MNELRPTTDSSTSLARPFTVESIESQLKVAWADLGARAEEENAPAPLRTSILTLVVVARGRREMNAAQDTLDRLMRVLPSRIILISIQNDTESLSAKVSAHCPIHQGDKASCYEMIEIGTGPGDLRAIPSILTQLEIADLPTFIWWMGAVDVESRDFRRISSAAQRIIIDSSKFRYPSDVFDGYCQYLNEHTEGMAGTDLAWGRLLTLRELLAQSFDDQAAQEMLPELQRVDMTIHPDARAHALLMAGWLSSRLGWVPEDAHESADTITLSARKEDQQIIQFNLSQVAGARRELRALRLVAHSGTRSSRVTVRRTDAVRAAVSIEMTDMPRRERIVHCVDRRDDEVLGGELLQFSRDLIYEESLASAAIFASILQQKRA
jgi:glucose-6-phosphate dehydrogenase assembly protein OpcA